MFFARCVFASATFSLSPCFPIDLTTRSVKIGPPKRLTPPSLPFKPTLPNKEWPNLLVEHVVDDGGGNGDNLWDVVNHRLFPRCQCNISQPRWYSQLHTLAHVAADHEAVCNLPIPNGTAENTKTFSSKLQIESKWRYGRYS